MATTEPVPTEVPTSESSAPMTSPNASLYVGELGKYLLVVNISIMKKKTVHNWKNRLTK